MYFLRFEPVVTRFKRKWVLLVECLISKGVIRAYLKQFGLHIMIATNEELVISLFNGREVRERRIDPIVAYILTA